MHYIYSFQFIKRFVEIRQSWLILRFIGIVIQMIQTDPYVKCNFQIVEEPSVE